MTPEQFTALLNVLTKIGDRQFTITGAADWPILALMITALCATNFALLGVIWNSLLGAMREGKKDNLKCHDDIWHAMRDCKEDCCGTVGRERGTK